MTKSAFLRAVRKYQRLYGLTQWVVNVEMVDAFEGDDPTSEIHGMLQFNRASMTAEVLVLRSLSDDEMEATARHEMCHLLLAPYRHLCSTLIENLDDDNARNTMYRLLMDTDEQVVIALDRARE